MKLKIDTEKPRDILLMARILKDVTASMAKAKAPKGNGSSESEIQHSPEPTIAVPKGAQPTKGVSIGPLASSQGEITKEIVQEELLKVVVTHREACAAKLKELGSNKLSDLNPSKYEDFYNFLKTLN